MPKVGISLRIGVLYCQTWDFCQRRKITLSASVTHLTNQDTNQSGHQPSTNQDTNQSGHQPSTNQDTNPVPTRTPIQYNQDTNPVPIRTPTQYQQGHQLSTNQDTNPVPIRTPPRTNKDTNSVPIRTRTQYQQGHQLSTNKDPNSVPIRTPTQYQQGHQLSTNQDINPLPIRTRTHYQSTAHQTQTIRVSQLNYTRMTSPVKRGRERVVGAWRGLGVRGGGGIVLPFTFPGPRKANPDQSHRRTSIPPDPTELRRFSSPLSYQAPHRYPPPPPPHPHPTYFARSFIPLTPHPPPPPPHPTSLPPAFYSSGSNLQQSFVLSEAASEEEGDAEGSVIQWTD